LGAIFHPSIDLPPSEREQIAAFWGRAETDTQRFDSLAKANPSATV
jgi:hypothetical protein